MNFLFILNDPPYGTERVYNGLRLALNILKTTEGASLAVFLMGDAVAAAKSGQQTPNGYYNLGRMVKSVRARNGEILLCGTCMDARGIADSEIVEGSRRSTLDELTELTKSSDKVLVF